MSVYAVTYDLHKPSQDYKALIEQLKKQNSYSHRFDSFWLIDSNLTAVELRDSLKSFIDADDSLLVVKTTNNWAALNLADGGVNWLKNDNRSF